jgi:hypothetical protein
MCHANAVDAALAASGVTAEALSPAAAAALDRDGYFVFRNPIPRDWIGPLIDRFEALDTPSHLRPIPREFGTRHAMLDDDAIVRRACLLPVILAAVFHYLGRRFHLASVEGRDPLPGHGAQRLHRDWTAEGPTPLVKALAFLDPYGPGNGATRVIPGSHSEPGDGSAFRQYGDDHPRQVVLEGEAGDVFLFHGRLAHAGTRNVSGTKRRALQMWFCGHELYQPAKETRALSGLSPLERFWLGQSELVAA